MKKNKIRNLILFSGSGSTPSRKEDAYWNSRDIPWLKTDQIGDYKIYDTNEYVSKKAFDECSLKIYPAGAISMAMYGEGKTRGSVSIIASPMTTNQACFTFVVDEEKINSKYVYYFLLNQYNNLRQLSSGVRKNLNADIIKNFEIIYPESRTQQDAIANVLESLDDKILANQKIITTIESMAKTLYDYWFVQFDFPDANGNPYKTSGGKMEWNETLSREIPAGWEVDNLFRIASYVNGLACQKYRPQDEEESLPVIKIREMHEGVRADTERVAADIPLENVIYDGDILFSWSATLEIQYWSGGKAGLNQHIFKVIPNEDYPKEYVYHQLKNYIVNFVKIAEARKTTMGHITQDHLKFSRIVIPPYDVLRRFEEQMKPIHNQMVKCNQENRKLTYLRDFLLPMLMNGQVTFRQ